MPPVAGYSAPAPAPPPWYRSGAGAVARSLAEKAPDPDDRIAVPATVLWPEYDPLFPRAWADRVEEFFSAIAVRFVDGPAILPRWSIPASSPPQSGLR